jgi:prepilin-type processing-associated H-X9-DG protein
MTGSYRGMSGVSCTGFDQWAGYPSEGLVLIRQCPGNRGLLHTDGPDTGLQPERMLNIVDGTSTTIMIGERATRTTPNRTTFWANSFNLYSLSGAFPQSATLLNDYDACGRVASDIAQCKYGWGSFHAGGNSLNFAFGDGSVRSINIGINMNVFVSLATIANGEVIPGDF